MNALKPLAFMSWTSRSAFSRLPKLPSWTTKEPLGGVAGFGAATAGGAAAGGVAMGSAAPRDAGCGIGGCTAVCGVVVAGAAVCGGDVKAAAGVCVGAAAV